MRLDRARPAEVEVDSGADWQPTGFSLEVLADATTSPLEIHRIQRELGIRGSIPPEDQDE